MRPQCDPHPPQRNPLLRPSAGEALEDPWLASKGMASDVPLKVHSMGVEGFGGYELNVVALEKSVP